MMEVRIFPSGKEKYIHVDRSEEEVQLIHKCIARKQVRKNTGLTEHDNLGTILEGALTLSLIVSTNFTAPVRT
jgi:hypothetical protein